MKYNIDEINLEVDPNNLTGEWTNQAAMMLHFSTALAKARTKADAKKADLACLVAELDQQVRDNPKDFGLLKATETTVGHAITKNADHKKATATHLKARHEVRLLEAAVDALEHRRRTLQGLTSLHCHQPHPDGPGFSRNVWLRQADEDKAAKEAAKPKKNNK